MYELVGDVHAINLANAPIWSGISKDDARKFLSETLPDEIRSVEAFSRAYNSNRLDKVYLEGIGPVEDYWKRFSLFSKYTNIQTKRKHNTKDIFLDEDFKESEVLDILINRRMGFPYTEDVKRICKDVLANMGKGNKYLPLYFAKHLEASVDKYTNASILSKMKMAIKTRILRDYSDALYLSNASYLVYESLQVEREAQWLDKLLKNGDGLIFCGASHIIKNLAIGLRRKEKDSRILHLPRLLENADHPIRDAMWNAKVRALHDTEFIEELLR